MNTEKTISNIVEDLQNEAMPFDEYVYEPKKTHQIIRKHLSKQCNLYSVGLSAFRLDIENWGLGTYIYAYVLYWCTIIGLIRWACYLFS